MSGPACLYPLSQSLHPQGSISSVSVWPSLNHKTGRSIQRAEAVFFLVGIFSNICLPTQLEGGLLDLRGWSSAWRIRSGGGPDLCRHLAAFDHLGDLPAWDPFHQSDFLLLVRCRSKGNDPKPES